MQASISCYTLPGQSPINDSKSTLDFLSMFMIEFFAKFKIEFASWGNESGFLQLDSMCHGDKLTARDTMKNDGVPTVPGSDGLLQV